MAISYNTVTTLFNEGKAAAIIGGPWLVSGIEAPALTTAWPPVRHQAAQRQWAGPFSGIQGVGVLKTALTDKKDAIVKVLNTFPQLLSMFALFRVLRLINTLNTHGGLVMIYAGSMCVFAV